MKTFYLLAAIVGTVVPWIFFAGFIVENGIDVPVFLLNLFANQPAAGFATDLLITSAVFWTWSWNDAREKNVSGWWLTIPAILLVGLSLGLPLYLWMREMQRNPGRPVAS